MVTILTTVIREATKHLNSRSERLLFSLSPLRSLSRPSSARDERAPLNSAQKNWANMSETPSDNKGREERAKKAGAKTHNGLDHWVSLSPIILCGRSDNGASESPLFFPKGRRFFFLSLALAL